MNFNYYYFITMIYRLIILGLLILSSSHSNSFEFDLSKYQNKVVYLDFWASWCIPCHKSFPWMNKMHEKYKNDGLVIIAVNLDEEKALAETFLEKYQANFLIEFDSGPLAEKYNVQGMPYAILFDRQGQINYKHIGFKQDKKELLESKIKSLLRPINSEN